VQPQQAGRQCGDREAGGCVGAMSYYTASGESPGVWAGTGAERLGLTGQVDPRVIEALCMMGSQELWSAGELAATWPAICREYHAPEARE
jgi:hypothetical protein